MYDSFNSCRSMRMCFQTGVNNVCSVSSPHYSETDTEYSLGGVLFSDLSPRLPTAKELAAQNCRCGYYIPYTMAAHVVTPKSDTCASTNGVGGCSAKSAHSPEHFEAKESWGISHCNSISNEFFCCCYYYECLRT